MHEFINTSLDGGISAVSGFSASGVSCGIKKTGLDLGLVHSQCAANAAAMFTQNRIKGAHVPYCQRQIAQGQVQTLVVNSGNANACNGARGAEHVQGMADAVAAALGIAPGLVFPCSTGTIGRVLPMDKVRAGIADGCAALAEDGGGQFARAIMTTDTKPKEEAVSFTCEGRTVTVGGVAKGAGMIEPNMATMLAFVATDADVAARDLDALLKTVAATSFNAISVDGDQSCNDTLLLMANGVSGVSIGPNDSDKHSWEKFCAAVRYVCESLARKIVMDGEGATKFVTVHVADAASPADARAAARAIANSLLVKTSWYGEDPNWGRVIDVVGYSGADVEETSIAIRYDDVLACDGKQGPCSENLNPLKSVLKQDAFSVNVNLGKGNASCVVHTCDCSEEYVRINADYTT